MATSTASSSPGLFRRLGAAGPVAILLSFWPPLGGFLLLATLTELGPWLRDHGAMGMIVYFLLAGLLMGISFVPTYACAILAGWAFGFAIGWPLALVTVTVSSLLAYAIGRGIARDRVVDVIREKPSWYAIHRALLGRQSHRALLVVTLLRIPPAAPFALANFVLAAARVSLREYTIGTFIGRIPWTATATYAAAQLEQLRFKDVADRWTTLAGIAATIAVCIVIGALANRALRQLSAAPGGVGGTGGE